MSKSKRCGFDLDGGSLSKPSTRSRMFLAISGQALSSSHAEEQDMALLTAAKRPAVGGGPNARVTWHKTLVVEVVFGCPVGI